MDQQTLLLKGLELCVYVLRIQRATSFLLDYYVEHGMDADDAASYMAVRGTAIRLKVLMAALGMIMVGMGISRNLDVFAIKLMGSVLMYGGLLLAAVQMKRFGAQTSGSFESIKTLFKK